MPIGFVHSNYQARSLFVVRNVVIRHLGVITARISPVIHILYPSIREKNVVVAFGRLSLSSFFVSIVIAAVVIPHSVAEGVLCSILKLEVNLLDAKRRRVHTMTEICYSPMIRNLHEMKSELKLSKLRLYF